MVAPLLSRAIRALCLSGITFGMTAAVAQETAATLQHLEGSNWTESVAAYSDPETEVGNGSDPPNRIEANRQIEVDKDAEPTMESYNFPETEIGNGTFPPKVNP